MSSHHSAHPYSPLQNAFRQLKFVIPGGILTYYLGTHRELIRIATQGEGWGRIIALISLAFGIITIALFMYMLMIPLVHGQEPNYRAWRESRLLSTVIPTLTASILLGWSLLVLTFGRSSNFGYITGTLGATGLYALTFGLMGLIPAPRARRI